MNRLLTEGRRAFLRRVSGIERGAECGRYEPLLSALADGEASADDLALLRPHMQTCLSCRARLREFRAMPERVASVIPPAALVAAGDGGPLRAFVESVVGAAQHKAAVLGERAQAAAELVSAQKVAAVAASAAALAGSGTAVDQFANHQSLPQPTPPVEQVEAKPVKDEVPVEPAPPAPLGAEPVATTPQPSPAPAPEPPPPPDPANEFAPGASAQAAPPSPAPAMKPGGGGFAPAGGGGDGSRGGASGEFAP